MALSERIKKDLEDKSFPDLFNDRKQHAKWVRLALKAYEYVMENMTLGKEPRLDDISAALWFIIEVDVDFRKHQDQHNARGQEWAKWFSDYVVDQVIGDGKKTQLNSNNGKDAVAKKAAKAYLDAQLSIIKRHGTPKLSNKEYRTLLRQVEAVTTV